MAKRAATNSLIANANVASSSKWIPALSSSSDYVPYAGRGYFSASSPANAEILYDIRVERAEDEINLLHKEVKKIAHECEEMRREISEHLTLLSLRFSLESYQTMLASERVLRKDWDQPEEDEAWQNL